MTLLQSVLERIKVKMETTPKNVSVVVVICLLIITAVTIISVAVINGKDEKVVTHEELESSAEPVGKDRFSVIFKGFQYLIDSLWRTQPNLPSMGKPRILRI